jgi:hypothetical protein
LGILSSRVFVCRRPTKATRERDDSQTTLELILVALEHIEAHGSLLLLEPDHAWRVRLMRRMTEFELVVWNAVAKKYELTPFGCQCLAARRGNIDLDFIPGVTDKIGGDFW